MFQTSRRSRATLISLALVAGSCLTSHIACARQADGGKPTSPALKGPAVKDRKVPGVAPEFGTSVDGKRRFADRLSPEVFRKALAVLTADNAPADIGATDEQRVQFKRLVDGFEQQVREYRRKHASEFAELRKAAGELGEKPKGKNAKNNGAADEMSGPMEPNQAEQTQRESAKEKLRQLTEGAPKVESVYTQVWTSLSAPQQKAVDGKLNEFRAEQAKKREDAYVQQKTGKKVVDGSTSKNPMPAGEPGKVSPEMRERLMQFFAQLTPEEQEQLMSRLKERFKDRLANNTPSNGTNAKRQGKPAPNPESVNVPTPDDKK